ncbi:MAG: hypothetical protein J6K04_13345 [Lachnospiraceae bacterium]|nr:hypothetical protein [Lachnospiraceae bacterium]
MQIKTNIAKVVDEVSDKAKYDNEVKKVLSDPQILSWILKYTVREFKEYSINEIMNCIEGTPEVAVHPVHPGHYTEPVKGSPTESAEIGAQKVSYDIRFQVAVPGEGSVGMIINVEAQNKFYESYDLVSRGVFYCARLLSTQVRNEESATEYNNLQKVYSIWICMDVPVNSEYTITGYRMNREDRYGHMASTANQRYDLMELVMICLGRPEDAANGTELHQLLTVVLSDKLTPEEKIDMMRDDFNIVTSVELEGGLAKMCNLSEYIEEKGLRRGIEQGLTIGAYNTLFSLVQDGLLTPDVAAERAKLNLEEFETLYQEYASKIIE